MTKRQKLIPKKPKDFSLDMSATELKKWAFQDME